MGKKQRIKINQSFIKGIKQAIPKHCSNCGNKYEEKDLTLIQKEDYTAVLHLTCSKCKESYLINVLTPLGHLKGASRVPLKIDLSSAGEAKKFVGKGPVSSDDVIDVHKTLEDIQSAEDLKKLLTAYQENKK